MDALLLVGLLALSVMAVVTAGTTKWKLVNVASILVCVLAGFGIGAGLDDHKRETLQKRQIGRGQALARQEHTTSIVRMKLVGADQNAEVTGLKPLPGIVNYLIGKNPEKWHKGIRTYSTVQYSNIYPNVDLVYYGNQRQLEYDFILKQGADPKQISLGFESSPGCPCWTATHNSIWSTQVARKNWQNSTRAL
jgi:hypothetical protein